MLYQEQSGPRLFNHNQKLFTRSKGINIYAKTRRIVKRDSPKIDALRGSTVVEEDVDELGGGHPAVGVGEG